MPADFFIANTTTATVRCDGLAWSGGESLGFECACNGAWIDRIRRSSKIWAKIEAGTLELQDAGGQAVPLVSGVGVGVRQAFEFLTKTDSPNSLADCINVVACAPVLAGQPVYLDAAGLACPANASTKESASVVGIAISGGLAGEEIQVCCSGNICLTPSEWDAAHGSTGGLVPGAAYWLGSSGVSPTYPSNDSISIMLGSALSNDCLCFSPGAVCISVTSSSGTAGPADVAPF